MTVDELLCEHTRHVAVLAHRLRDVIQKALPDAEERVYPGWHGIGYHDPVAGYVCAIFPKKGAVEVAFEHGASLPNPNRLLQRGGKQVRYAIFHEWNEERAEHLAELIDLATGAP